MHFTGNKPTASKLLNGSITHIPFAPGHHDPPKMVPTLKAARKEPGKPKNLRKGLRPS